MGVIVLALTMSRIVFSLPVEGSLLLYLALASLYVFVCIGLGMMLATLAGSQQQVILSAFFINVPLIILSGAISPVEGMPVVFQYLSLINPLRHFIEISRGLLWKGAGLGILWPNALALAFIATLLLTVSVTRFRKQLR
jgi:ABC-2 type transport system permease protein